MIEHIVTTDGFSTWEGVYNVDGYVRWDVGTPDGYILLEKEGETAGARMMKQTPDGYVVYAPEFPWFLEFAGINACHSFYQYHVISQVMKLSFDSIVELGTYRGALSMYLGIVGAQKDIPVYTFDRDLTYSDPAAPALKKLGVERVEMDYLTEEGIARVMECVGDKPTYLICDGDNRAKESEFRLFSRLVPVGSVISIHDFFSEVEPGKIVDITSDNNLREFGMMDWSRHRVNFATFVKEG